MQIETAMQSEKTKWPNALKNFPGSPKGAKLNSFPQALMAVGLFLLVLVVFYPGREVNLVADDFRLVGRIGFSDALRSLHDTVGFGRSEYRPLIAFSFALSNALWGSDPTGYHLESIVLHGLNVVLLYWWLLRLTRSHPMAVVSAVVFAVHPIHHARVVWIAARDSLWSTLFVLASLIFYTLARRTDDQEIGVCRKRAFFAISLGLFVMSLFSYEGAAIFPGILAALELFCFSGSGGNRWRKIRNAVVKTTPFTLVLILYVTWWLMLFEGKAGQYDLSLSISNLWGNYYSLLYQLFYGHQHLAGVLYFILLLFGLFLPRMRIDLLWFSVLFMSVSFLPFVCIAGFASRFAYASAIGYSLLIALLLCAAAHVRVTGHLPGLRHSPLLIAILVFGTLTVYYTANLKARIADWKTAGRIAEKIPSEIKSRLPDLPQGSTLVLEGIPRMVGHAYVYPLGLEESIERYYPGRNLNVVYGAGTMREVSPEGVFYGRSAYYLRYLPATGGMEQVGDLQR